VVLIGVRPEWRGKQFGTSGAVVQRGHLFSDRSDDETPTRHIAIAFRDRHDGWVDTIAVAQQPPAGLAEESSSSRGAGSGEGAYMGGIAGADSICQTAGHPPVHQTWLAYLARPGQRASSAVKRKRSGDSDLAPAPVQAKGARIAQKFGDLQGTHSSRPAAATNIPEANSDPPRRAEIVNGARPISEKNPSTT